MSTDTTPTNQTVTSPPPLVQGVVLGGRYRLDRCLASGGYGDVWKGNDEETDREIAVKILRTDAGNNDPAALARMRQEAEILQAMEHPNIVTVYGFHTSEYGEFVVMEFLDGLAIDQILQVEGPGESERVIPVVRQLLSALEMAHSKEVLHRDIKPENIILSKDPSAENGEVAKLVDFGIAKAQRLLSEDSDAGVTLVQTRSGGFIGTPRYSAPEQAVGDPMGPNVDLFSLGLVLAEWLTGKQRLDAERHGEVMSQLLSPDPIDISDTPYRWQAWLAELLKKDPRERIQNADQALRAFEEMVVEGHDPPDFLEEGPFTPTPGFDAHDEQESDRAFAEHDGPLELDFDRVEQLETQRRELQRPAPEGESGPDSGPGGREPAGTPVPPMSVEGEELGGGGLEGPPRAQDYVETRKRDRPDTPAPAPRRKPVQEEGKGGTLVAVGWMIAVFILTVALVFVLMVLFAGAEG